MVVIHQPRYSIFEMFDTVLLLSVGGKTVFLGPVYLAEAYFNFLGFRPPPNENRAGRPECCGCRSRSLRLAAWTTGLGPQPRRRRGQGTCVERTLALACKRPLNARLATGVGLSFFLS